ncbi:glutathione S-transferase [Algiphilus sp. W345]|uniref:Glutathione S-transferase n=1 Tax=Banduia mediterranea TaxID=3075609 RepID=A0ABU2WM88_9GAMM|nr:glutathione S-transferase [Algiphilus sp. W345]MDT0498734.1 glutathione S-transferase [Algiphilus sp. W345]
MFKLYGFPVSNYYNMVKLALLHKGLAFEEIIMRPSQEQDYLSKSPMGKIPCLQTPDGFISETNVILDFLDEAYPDKALLPKEHFARAKVRELSKSIELYVELVARQLYRGIFFGETLSEELKIKVRPELEKGVAALKCLLQFSPYAAGAQLTQADLMLYYTANLADMVAKRAYGIDLATEVEGLRDWQQMMDNNPLVQQVNRDRDQALKSLAG